MQENVNNNENEEKKKESVNKENVVNEEKEKQDNNELEKMNKELEETTDRLKRLMAEFENYKKRSSKERELLYNSILADVISAILPAVDNLEKAVNTETKDEQYKQGIQLVDKQIKDVLNSFGVEKIETIGQKFDPEIHEAVNHVEDPDLGEQEIKDEYRAGYKIGNKVIRHSMVIVAN